MEDQILTLKNLQEATNAPAYLIQYLKACNRLKIATTSKGRGYPTLYHFDSIKIINDHLAKQDLSL